MPGRADDKETHELLAGILDRLDSLVDIQRLLEKILAQLEKESKQ